MERRRIDFVFTGMRDPQEIVIGTRGSALALVQVEATEAALHAVFPGISLRREIILTTGDRRTDVALAEVAKVDGTVDKGVFIKEIENALERAEIDIAVHSLKDLPTVLDEGFRLAAVLKRASVRDVLLTRTPNSILTLPAGTRVGTSSVRRAKQLLWMRPDLEVLDLRGNVPTRVHKLSQGDDYDAILLAEAGLVRLGFLPEISPHSGPESVAGVPNLYALRLSEDEFFPAAGQGAIGLEVRSNDAKSATLVDRICHRETWLRVSAEREFLRLVDGGCSTPIAVFSSIYGSSLTLKARLFSEDGGPPQVGTATGLLLEPLALAAKLFSSLS